MARSEALKAAQERYLSGKPSPIVFRLDGEPRERLRQRQKPGESENQAAKRLLLEFLKQMR